MTSEHGIPSPAKQSPQVVRARAELVAALEAIEDKVNVPRRLKRFRAERPGVVTGALATAGAVAAGAIALAITAAVRRR